LGRHQARSLTGEGFAKAIDLFSQAVALDPEYVPAWSALAEAYLGTVSWGNASWFSVMDDAEAAVEQALMLDPNSVDALLAKSMMLRFQQKDAEARALDEQALATDPMNPEALRRMADTLRSTDPQRSLANAEQALDIDPLSELIRITVIRSTRKALGMGPARERYEEFLAQDPDSWVLIEQWARLEDNAGNSDLAILEFEKVFSLREDAYSAAAMAILYLDLGDEAEAERWAEQARELGPDSEWTRGLTFRFAWYRQDFETLMSLLRAQSETPQGKDPLYYSGLGQVLMAMDRPEEAEAAFRQSLQMLAPDETAIPTGLELSVIGELAFLLPQGTERSQLVERIRARYEAIRLADPDSRPVAALAAQIALLEDHRDDYFAAASRAIDTGYRGRRWMELEVSYRVWKDDPRFSELLGRLDQIAADQRARLEAARAEAAHNAGVSI
ncbi:MAG: tetratricopeptide repeat protein, partial [Pseudomonadota bacterium]